MCLWCKRRRQPAKPTPQERLRQAQERQRALHEEFLASVLVLERLCLEQATTIGQPLQEESLQDAMLAAVGGNEEHVRDFLHGRRCDAEAERLGLANNAAAFAHAMNSCAGGSDPRAEYQRAEDWVQPAPARPGIKQVKEAMRMLPHHFWVCRGVVLSSKGDQQLALANRCEQREKDLVYMEVKQQPLESVEAADAEHASKGLVAYSQLLPYIIGAVQGDWRKDKFMGLCHFMHCPLVDRTGTLQGCPLKLIVCHPIPKRDFDFKTPLDELMLERARELLAESEAEAKPLEVLWSGGLDTTAVVVAFLKVTEPEGRQRIRIRYRPDSLAENPGFFEKVIQPNFPSTLPIAAHVRDLLYDGSTEGRLLVTGDPCDMLFGTFMMASSFKPRHDAETGLENPLHGQLEAPWREALPAAVRARGLLLGNEDGPEAYDEAAAEWVRWMEPYMQAAPIEVVSVFDALWWMVYGLKYQHDLLRIFYNSPGEEVPEHVRGRLRNFYEPEPFHQWSFNFHGEKMASKSVWASYKWPLKTFVRDFVSQEYHSTKIKVVSTRNSFGLECGFDHNWRAVKFGLFSISMEKLKRKYGDPAALLQRFCDPMYLHTFGTMPVIGMAPLAVFFAHSYWPPHDRLSE